MHRVVSSLVSFCRFDHVEIQNKFGPIFNENLIKEKVHQRVIDDLILHSDIMEDIRMEDLRVFSPYSFYPLVAGDMLDSQLVVVFHQSYIVKPSDPL